MDPPKFANNANHIAKAARGYKDLSLQAFKRLGTNGFLATFSCSGSISLDLFSKIQFGAIADANRTAQISRYLMQGDDHPVSLFFPEALYLKGLLIQVD